MKRKIIWKNVVGVKKVWKLHSWRFSNWKLIFTFWKRKTKRWRRTKRKDL